MSKFLKKDQISSSWYEIDAQNAVVGRLATIISKIIRGKNKTTYTPVSYTHLTLPTNREV